MLQVRRTGHNRGHFSILASMKIFGEKMSKVEK